METASGTVAWRRELPSGGDAAQRSLVAVPCAVIAAVGGRLSAVGRAGTLAWSAEMPGELLSTDGDVLYSLDDRGYVRSATVADGARRWKRFYGSRNLDRVDGFADPAVFDGETLFAGTYDGRLLALDAESGRRQWMLSRNWRNPPRLAVADETVYTAWGSQLAAFR